MAARGCGRRSHGSEAVFQFRQVLEYAQKRCIQFLPHLGQRHLPALLDKQRASDGLGELFHLHRDGRLCQAKLLARPGKTMVPRDGLEHRKLGQCTVAKIAFYSISNSITH